MGPICNTLTTLPQELMQKVRCCHDALVEKTKQVSSRAFTALAAIAFLASGALFIHASILQSPLHFISSFCVFKLSMYLFKLADSRLKDEKVNAIRLDIENLTKLHNTIHIAEIIEEPNPDFTEANIQKALGPNPPTDPQSRQAMLDFFGPPATRKVANFQSKEECLAFYQFVPDLLTKCRSSSWLTLSKDQIDMIESGFNRLKSYLEDTSGQKEYKTASLPLNNDLQELSRTIKTIINVLQKQVDPTHNRVN